MLHHVGGLAVAFAAAAPSSPTLRPATRRRADAIDGIRGALESRLAELGKSAERGRLAQQF